jgi:hypothetical protein
MAEKTPRTALHIEISSPRCARRLLRSCASQTGVRSSLGISQLQNSVLHSYPRSLDLCCFDSNPLRPSIYSMLAPFPPSLLLSRTRKKKFSFAKTSVDFLSKLDLLSIDISYIGSRTIRCIAKTRPIDHVRPATNYRELSISISSNVSEVSLPRFSGTARTRRPSSPGRVPSGGFPP